MCVKYPSHLVFNQKHRISFPYTTHFVFAIILCMILMSMLLIIQLQIFGVNIDGAVCKVQEVTEDVVVLLAVTLIAGLNHLQQIV